MHTQGDCEELEVKYERGWSSLDPVRIFKNNKPMLLARMKPHEEKLLDLESKLRMPEITEENKRSR